MSEKENTNIQELMELQEKYENTLSQNPESDTFSLLASVLYRQGKLDKAIGVLIKGLGYNKNNVMGRFLLGKIYYERWMIDQAKKEMEKVLGAAPDNLEAAILISQIYKSEGKLDKALEILNSAYTFHSNNHDLGIEIGEIKNQISRAKEQKSNQAFQTPAGSRKIEEIKIDESFENEEIYTQSMANLYIEQGQYSKARKILEKIYTNEFERNTAIEKLEKIKLNKMNTSAGFNPKD